MDNPEIMVQDERIEKLDEIVCEVKQSEEWEAVSMSIYKTAWEQGLESGREEGMKQGMKQGANRKLVEQICKKLKKNKSPEQIADELEEDIELINRICELTIKEEYDIDHICEKI